MAVVPPVARAAALVSAVAVSLPGAALGQDALDLGQEIIGGPAPRSGDALGRSSNPAALGMPGPRVGLGIVGPAAGSYTLGPVSGLKSDIEELADIANFETTDSDKAKEKVDRANAILDRLGNDGYATAHGRAKIVPAPLSMKIPAGALGTLSLGLDLEVQGAGHVAVLDDDFKTNSTDPGVEVQTNTSLYVKRAVLARASLGYGRKVIELGRASLYAGTRVNYYEGQLSKAVLAVDIDADDQPNLAQMAQDELSRTGNSARALGVDAGLAIEGSVFGRPVRTSILGRDLNGPTLAYGAIGQNCNDISDADSRRNCNTAQYFSDRISLAESTTLGPRVLVASRMEGVDSPWGVTASADLFPYYDAVAQEYQWLRVGGSYTTRRWYVPNARIGYRHNIAGTGLGLLGAGFTFFRVWDVDVASSLATVTVDDTTLPRSLMVSTGVTVTF